MSQKSLIILVDPNKYSKDPPYSFIDKQIIVSATDVLSSRFERDHGILPPQDLYEYYERNFSPAAVATIILDELSRTFEGNLYLILSGIRTSALLNEFEQTDQASVYFLAITPSLAAGKDEFNDSILRAYLNADFYINPFVSRDDVVAMWFRFLGFISNDNRVRVPSQVESNMFAAYTAMFRSHCLSRAVGASVATATGELITSGWNDVPRAGGGVYQSGDPNHCFAWTSDPSGAPNCHKDLENQAILTEIEDELREQGVRITERERYILAAIGKLQIKGLLEFSRSVHAEMHTIIKAGQIAADNVIGGELYVTAYPCHNCARHIILSGIKTIYYIEPFLKSRAIKLHSDSLISTNDISEATALDPHRQKVWLIPYQGVGGRGFERFFRRKLDLKADQTIPFTDKFSFVN